MNFLELSYSDLADSNLDEVVFVDFDQSGERFCFYAGVALILLKRIDINYIEIEHFVSSSQFCWMILFACLA